MNKSQLLAEIADEIKRCPLCRLAETRTHAVPGEGTATARVMFVGEGPGQNEDETGRPFVGAAGQLLNELLKQAGINREDVFISNVVKCRPPQNREPLADEIEACSDYLMAQIAVIDPAIVCPLGSHALKTLLDPKLSITKVRAQVFRKNGILFIPLYHPAAVLRRRELLPDLEADFRTLRELLNREIREDEIRDLSAVKAKPAKKDEPPPEETLSLF